MVWWLFVEWEKAKMEGWKVLSLAAQNWPAKKKAEQRPPAREWQDTAPPRKKSKTALKRPKKLRWCVWTGAWGVTDEALVQVG